MPKRESNFASMLALSRHMHSVEFADVVGSTIVSYTTRTWRVGLLNTVTSFVESLNVKTFLT